MFKNLMVFRISTDWTASVEAMEKALDKARFTPCAATQMLSVGFVEPRGIEHSPLVENIAGHLLLRIQSEKKTVPGAAIKRRVAEMAKRIEEETGRKPGRKAMKELKEEALFELLPMAFSKVGVVDIWIDPKTNLLMVGAGSQARSDEVMTALAQNLEGFSATHIHTERSAQSLMSDWLLSMDPDDGFSIDRECELKAPDETKAVVRYSRHSLDCEDLREHIKGGKVPTKVALTWGDENGDRISFMLSEDGQLRKISFLDGVYDGTKGDDDKFDTDAAIATGELSKLIEALINALGGEIELGSEAGQAETPAADEKAA